MFFSLYGWFSSIEPAFSGVQAESIYSSFIRVFFKEDESAINCFFSIKGVNSGKGLACIEGLVSFNPIFSV
jgi:hypothetical protein